jgi:hypothetical protein
VRLKGLVLAAMAGAIATPVMAQTDLTRSAGGYTYFNKPGADMEIHDADLRECRHQALQMVQPDLNTNAGAGHGLIGALVAAVIEGAMDSMYERRGLAANIENCMVVAGWRVVRMPDQDGQALAARDQFGQANQLAGLVGAQDTQGEVVRTYGNEIAAGGAVVFAQAGDLDKPSLSLTALAPLEEESVEKPDLPKMEKSARPPKPLAPEKLGQTPEGYAVVVVRLRGSGLQNGETLTLERAGPYIEIPAWVDGQPASATASLPMKFLVKGGSRLEKTTAFAVPPGRWRLAGLSQGLFQLSLCLGAPAFDVAAGEVVFAGDFDLSASTVPDLDPATARAALAAAPALAERVRPAVYVNGYKSQCGGAAYLYAYEIPGAPFANAASSPRPAAGQPAPPAPVAESPAPARP